MENQKPRFKIAHIGVNCEDEHKAASVAAMLAAAFDMEVREGRSSIFLDNDIEVMKTPFYGKFGHIGIYTNDVESALVKMKQLGYTIREETIKRDNFGNILVVYFVEEIAGYAIHLIQNDNFI